MLILCCHLSVSAVVVTLRNFNRGTGLENSTRPLVFTSVSGCRASESFDISTEH